MTAAIAAGHPATVEVGAAILGEGGTAADAAVAAALASCVAETVMTGLLGGGHAIYYDVASGRAENLDCFVAIPGLGGPVWDGELVQLEVPFGAELVHYAIGAASCGVPGVPAGLGELWRRFGRLEWPRLVEPALQLARGGVTMPPAHASCLAMLAVVMTMDAGGRIYAPGGRLLEAGDRLRQPGLVRALELLVEEGPGSAYSGSIAEALLALMDERGGLVTREDLAAYRAVWTEPVEVGYAGRRFLTRGGLADLADALRKLPPLRGRPEPERALDVANVLDDAAATGSAHTTNLSVVDAEGNACVLTTSLGLGSGDFVPGLDLHLNSMLGEVDLVRAGLETGDRMGSMMAPSVALDDGRLAFAGGAAGGTRLRSALVQVAAGILDEGLSPADAIERPRLHPVAARVQLEPGFEDATVDALAAAGYEPRIWAARHHFFGGVSVVTPAGAAGDPRRSGTSATVP